MLVSLFSDGLIPPGKISQTIHSFYHLHFNTIMSFLNTVVWVTQTTSFLLVGEVKS